MANPTIEHFDIFEENVRLGVDEPKDIQPIQNALSGPVPQYLLDSYQKAMAELSPEQQEQVVKNTRILKESAFPKRRWITVDSSSNGMDEALNNGIELYVYSSNIFNAQPRASAVFMGGAKMQSPIIYEEKKKSFGNWIAEKVRNIVK